MKQAYALNTRDLFLAIQTILRIAQKGRIIIQNTVAQKKEMEQENRAQSATLVVHMLTMQRHLMFLALQSQTLLYLDWIPLN